MNQSFFLSSFKNNKLKIIAAKGQIAAEMDGELLILNSNSGIYYGLNPIGQTVWNLIQQPKTFAEVRDAILTKYEVSSERCQSDLLSLLEQLQSKGLILISNEAST
ncbi:PqqD family peptide modification chaperone [Myxosarcina sp. GI1]|uniref:PqqD family peptide modification chaperone n=1 Tax=Myxosarcina sp. GI1 TaxID=1541065 RepID=UPI00055C1F9E|nr:PqqD family peptide modification chaperone [Myxosarcina sp. GI1]